MNGSDAKLAFLRAALLAETGAILSASLDAEGMVANIARLMARDFADACLFDLVMDDERLSELTAAYQDRSLLLDGSAAHVLSVPILIAGRLVGVMGLARSRFGFTPSETSLCLEIAQRAASPLDNARAYRAEHSARLEAERMAATLSQLQEITSELSSALTPAQVAGVVARKSVAALGASLALVFVPSADGEWLEIVGNNASPSALLERFQQVPIDSHTPAAIAYRHGEIEAVESMAEYRDRFPELFAAAFSISGSRALLSVPLLFEGRAIGVLALSFREERRFAAEDHSFALTLARQCAQALDRARLFEAEHRLNERLRLLAQAGEMLSSSLDYETTLLNVVALPIPALADVCLLSVVEGALVRRIGRSSGDPREDALLEDHGWERAVGVDLDPAPLSVRRSGFYPDLEDRWSPREPSDPLGLALLRERGLCSVITVPLAARGEVLGAVTLGFASSGRRHTLVDLDLAEELAGRAATAIENARLHRASREATRLAEQANMAKDEFLGVVSHELRTPLNAILGWSQLLLHERGKTAALLEKGLTAIDRNARTQAKLIEDLLDVSRIISGKLRIDLRPLDLEAVIRGSVEVVRPLADSLGIEVLVSSEPGAIVSGDPDRLQQVVVNLLSNAIKFTPTGGIIEASLVREGETASVVICDSGKGIDPAFLPHVFERFRQADSSTTRRHGGLGLGLAIVRSLVELHGGSVAAASEGPDRGATFTVTLPLREVIAAPGATPRHALDADANDALAHRLDGLKVLVVDDEPDALEMVATMLAITGAAVEVVSSASEAITRLDSFAADVLVSDVGMPGEDGYTLIRRIRSSTAPYAGIPAIALTAYASIEDARRATLAGFHAHLPKPAECEVLTAIIGNLTRRSAPEA